MVGRWVCMGSVRHLTRYNVSHPGDDKAAWVSARGKPETHPVRHAYVNANGQREYMVGSLSQRR